MDDIPQNSERTPFAAECAMQLRNMPTEGDLLSRAKQALEAGEKSMKDVAEALALAHQLHGTSQAEMARSIGKSEAWVSYVLRWHRSGYKEESPFGPRTKAGRVKHAEDRATSGKSKPRKGCIQPKAAANNAETRGDRTADADDAETSAERRKAKYAEQEAAPEMSASANTFPGRKHSPVSAKRELLYAIEAWWPFTDDAGRLEVIAFLLKQDGARVPENGA
jgi:hypothetical protein